MTRSNPKNWTRGQYERYFQKLSAEMLEKRIDPRMSFEYPRRWPRYIAIMAAVALLLAMVAAAMAGEPGCQFSFAPGTILATVNLDPSQNTSIGPLNPYYNHEGMVTADGFVVEGQSGPPYAPPGGAVIKTPLDQFMARPYRVWYYEQVYPEVGRRAALFAEAMVGSPYAPWASIGPQRVRALVASILGRVPPQSCVSVCRRAMEQATGRALWGWRSPSDIVWQGALLRGPYPVATAPPPPPPELPPVPEATP